MDTIVFGGGCFWCTEAVFQELKGVASVMSGYAGGKQENPIYWDVASGKSDHAEVIRIEYDPAQVTFHDLLTVFFATHDPTTPNRQGADRGPQYRSTVLYTTEEQKREAEQFIRALGPWIVTTIQPLGKFYEAEEGHRNYYQNNTDAPYCQIVIDPKLEKVQKEFAQLLKNHER